MSIVQLVRQIHASPTRVVVALAGGGSGAISRLLEMPGASRTVLEVVVPYSEPAMTDWLGGPPEQACSAQTARAMAMAAFLRAYRLADVARTARIWPFKPPPSLPPDLSSSERGPAPGPKKSGLCRAWPSTWWPKRAESSGG